jgi:putative lipase involved disintegration of autophagic bodies
VIAMTKPTEYYDVKRLFCEPTVKGWGNLTDDMETRDGAWQAFVDGFRGEAAPTIENAHVVLINMADGTFRDLTEDWCKYHADEFGPDEDQLARDARDNAADQRRYDRRDAA